MEGRIKIGGGRTTKNFSWTQNSVVNGGGGGGGDEGECCQENDDGQKHVSSPVLLLYSMCSV